MSDVSMTQDERKLRIRRMQELLADIHPSELCATDRIRLAQAQALLCIADQLAHGFIDINAYVSEP